jgi:hypothetical protein
LNKWLLLKMAPAPLLVSLVAPQLPLEQLQLHLHLQLRQPLRPQPLHPPLLSQPPQPWLLVKVPAAVDHALARASVVSLAFHLLFKVLRVSVASQVSFRI